MPRASWRENDLDARLYTTRSTWRLFASELVHPLNNLETMSYKIDEIEGIGPANREKLVAGGINNTDDLLAKCGGKKGRVECASATGIGESQLLKWANMADMMRVSGVGKQFAEILENSGVDTVKELATRNAANLAVKMKEVNDAKKLANAVPNEEKVQAWIDQAKGMDPCISH